MAKRTGRTLVRSLGLRFRPDQERLVRNYAGRNHVRPWRPRAKFAVPTSLQVCVSSSYVSRLFVCAVSARRARTKFDRIAAGHASPTFRSVVNSWGATNVVLKLTDNAPTLPAPVNPPTLPVPVPIIKFLGPSQGTDWFLERNQNVACVRGYVRLIAACG